MWKLYIRISVLLVVNCFYFIKNGFLFSYKLYSSFNVPSCYSSQSLHITTHPSESLPPAADRAKHKDSQQTLCRVWETLKPSTLTGCFHQISFLGLKKPCGRGGWKNRRAGGMDGTRETRPSKHSRVSAQELTEPGAASSGLGESCTRGGPRTERSEHRPHS